MRTGVLAAFLWMWPNARISVMGGDHTVFVLGTGRGEQLASAGAPWPTYEGKVVKAPVRAQYED